MGLRDFYRIFFMNSTQTANNEGDPFHSLYSFGATLGYQLYSLAFEIVIFLILIMTGIAFLQGYAAKDAQGRVENKDKIMRNVLITITVVSLTFIISTVYTIFRWNA